MMKKIISIMAGGVLLAATMSGCVDDNPTFVIRGLVPINSTCEAGSDTDETIAQELHYILNEEDKQICDKYFSSEDDTQFYVQFMNNSSDESVWASSGSSSSSGSTFDSEPPDRGMLVLKKIINECKSVNDDPNGYDQIKRQKLEKDYSSSVKANERFCAVNTFAWTQFIDEDSAKNMMQDGELKLLLDIYGKYADVGGLIKGTSSHAYLTITIREAGERNVVELEDYYKIASKGYATAKDAYYNALAQGKTGEDLTPYSEAFTSAKTAYYSALNEFRVACGLTEISE